MAWQDKQTLEEEVYHPCSFTSLSSLLDTLQSIISVPSSVCHPCSTLFSLSSLFLQQSVILLLHSSLYHSCSFIILCPSSTPFSLSSLFLHQSVIFVRHSSVYHPCSFICLSSLFCTLQSVIPVPSSVGRPCSRFFSLSFLFLHQLSSLFDTLQSIIIVPLSVFHPGSPLSVYHHHSSVNLSVPCSSVSIVYVGNALFRLLSSSHICLLTWYSFKKYT